ncbi:MAG: ribosomal protein S18-alanine N-acetyltransferase [Candidatus Hydrogenedentota bacterium]
MTTTSASHLHYEQLTDTLIPALQEIEHEAYPEPWTGGMFRDEIRNNNSHFFIAYLGDQLIGYSGFWLLIDVAHVTTVTVSQEHRGNGFGREQMHHLIKEATKFEARSLTLEVRESNATARTMYEHFGFKKIGLRRGYYAKSKEDAIVMEMLLDTTEGPETNG